MSLHGMAKAFRMRIRTSDKRLGRKSRAALGGGEHKRGRKASGYCCRDPGQSCSRLKKLPLVYIFRIAFRLWRPKSLVL